ncbi:hypothetical protein C5748_18105 [Phyllobacterium phragmitis]|uniref:Uncharacterized protein n=1 Tax=Phyllobacterium phragmitis TaxID=2670329 RepID=A0A2S9INH0_9HYPH|nr:hypothetical protein [Phyllobacterium phragmitis]PRD42071.1 hypothetical protein C5748_18105 [Phyllobacterium phragmitis]
MTPTPTAPEVADLLEWLERIARSGQYVAPDTVRAWVDPNYAASCATALRSLQAERDRLAERVKELLGALKEQTSACFCDDCEMCFRHLKIIAKAEGRTND